MNEPTNRLREDAQSPLLRSPAATTSLRTTAAVAVALSMLASLLAIVTMGATAQAQISGALLNDSGEAFSMAAGDFDDDGHVDLVLGTGFRAALKLYINNGTAAPFSGVDPISFGPQDLSYALVAADMNGDDRIDLISGNDASVSKLFLNNGTANPFSGAPIPFGPPTNLTYAVAVADLDGDDDLDVVLGDADSPTSVEGAVNSLFLNNGTFNPFNGVAAREISVEEDPTNDIALADMNGDDHIDLVVGGFGVESRLYLNNGTADPFAGVSASNITDDSGPITSIEVLDVNGDNNLDFVAAQFSSPNRVYINNGTADPFAGVSGSDFGGSARTKVLASGDLTGDNVPDLVAGVHGTSNRLYVNTSNGLANAVGTAIDTDNEATEGFAIADFDGDGDNDIAATSATAADDATNTARIYLTAGSPGGGAATLVVGLGKYPASGGYYEVIDSSAPFANDEWPRVPWSDYYSENGETRPVVCDVDGNGSDDIVTALGRGSNGWISIMRDGAEPEWAQVPWNSYNSNNGETFAACGDIDADGRDEIVAGLGASGGGWAYLFDDASTQYAAAGPGWINLGWSSYNEINGALHPAVGNIDNDPGEEIVFGTGEAGQRWTRFFDDAAGGYAPLNWVQAFDTGSIEKANHRVWPAICDGNLVLGASSAAEVGGNGWINVLDSSGERAGPVWFRANWSDYNDSVGATYPACGDLDGDGNDEIAVGFDSPTAEGYVALFDDLGTNAAFIDWPQVHWGAYNTAVGSTRPSIG